VATGSTPLPTYRRLGRRGVDLGSAEIFLLDEYIGLSAGSPHRYLATVRRVLGELAGVRPEQVVGPDVDADDLAAAAAAYDRRIGSGLDLQLLGLGRNGHIGFNEPDAGHDSTTRVVELARSTRAANARFFHGDEDAVPRRAMTQGIATILRAREILMVVTGAEKARALQGVIEGPISPLLPATALAHHGRTTIIADAQAASLIGDG
jgi:glucosamine-6-phosphate deaminase